MTPTPTGPVTTGAVLGRLVLERRASSAGAQIEVAGQTATSADNGEYVLPQVPAGTFILYIHHTSYLRTWRSVTIVAGQTLILPDVTLLAGDLNQDDRIDEKDAIIIGHAWNSTPADTRWNPRADITDEGVIDIRDMVAIQYNFFIAAPGPWPPPLP